MMIPLMTITYVIFTCVPLAQFRFWWWHANQLHNALLYSTLGNTLRQKQNDHHIPDDIFKHIFLNENVWISIKISLKFVPKGPINNIPALVQIMAWCWLGDKPSSEPMVVSLLMHICIAWPNELTQISDSGVGHCKCNIFLCNWFNTIDTWSVSTMDSDGHMDLVCQYYFRQLHAPFWHQAIVSVTDSLSMAS